MSVNVFSFIDFNVFSRKNGKLQMAQANPCPCNKISQYTAMLLSNIVQFRNFSLSLSMFLKVLGKKFGIVQTL